MTDKTQPEALRLALSIDLMDTFTGYQQEELEKAAAELRRQHARIAELEAQLEAVGAGGVQALSAAPAEADMFWDAEDGERFGNDIDDIISDFGPGDRVKINCAKRMPSIEVLVVADGDDLTYQIVSPTPPAEQQAEESHVKLLAECRDAFPIPEPGSPLEVQWSAAMARPEEVPEYVRLCVAAMQAAPKAAPEVPRLTRQDDALCGYLADCDDNAITPDVAGAFAWAWAHASVAAPQQEAQEPSRAAKTWCSYVAGMIGCYLNEPDESTKVQAIAGIIERRLWALPTPQPAPAPLSDDAKDAARWRMVALIGNEVMLHPEKRTQAAAVKAYMDATHGGSDLTGAVDAALAAQGGKA